MNKNIIIVVLILAVLALLYFIDPADTLHKPDTFVQAHNDSAAVIKTKLAEVEAREAQLAEEIREAKTREEGAKKRYERKIAVLQAKIQAVVAETRKADVAELDSIRNTIFGAEADEPLYAMPLSQARELLALGAVRGFNDSLLNNTQNRVAELEGTLVAQEARFTAQVLNLKDQVSKHDELNQHYQAVNEYYRKDEKKHRLPRILKDAGIAGVSFLAGRALR